MRRSATAMTVLALACLVAPASTLAQNAYITNGSDNTVSVINTATNSVIATVPVGRSPSGVAVTPDGSKVYVAAANTVSVINTATNAVIATIPVVGSGVPMGVAVTPDGAKVYVANLSANTVSIISTTTDTVIGSPIPVGVKPSGVAVTPDGSKVYVANAFDTTVSVINTATDTVIGSITGFYHPEGVAITPDGSKVYVTNIGNVDGTTVSVIGTATNTVIATVSVGRVPEGVAVTPDGSKVYVANSYSNSVSVISTTTNTVIATIPVDCNPFVCAPRGLAITPDGSKVYVADYNGPVSSVSVINTATNTVIGSPIPVGGNPIAFGMFISEPVASGIDKTSPVITVAANPPTLWPPNGKMVLVTVSGTMTDNEPGGTGVNPSTAAYAVTDEYGQVQPQGSVTLKSDGSYSFTIQLQASRDGNDKDGRQYIITVSAQDNAGNKGSAATGVIVPHDQGPAIPGQKSASNMLDQWNCGTMPLSLPMKARVVGG